MPDVNGFRVRDAHVTDPAYMDRDPADFLSAGALDEMAASIDPKRAAPWSAEPKPGDTVWLGAIDGEGRAVGFIQSLYWEFGSGLRDAPAGFTVLSAVGARPSACPTITDKESRPSEPFKGLLQQPQP